MPMKQDEDNVLTHSTGKQLYIMFGATVVAPC